jgi:hypothetical protein
MGHGAGTGMDALPFHMAEVSRKEISDFLFAPVI